MALTVNTFETLGGGVQQLHTYRTSDSLATVTAVNYFAPLADRLHPFDIIMLVDSTGGTPAMNVLAITSDLSTNVTVVSSAPAAAQVIGGVAIGSEGTGIYTGYTLSWGDDFDSLDIIAPHLPRGRYFTTNAASCSRGNDAFLAEQYDTDPYHTGHNDYNRGIPVGYTNMSVAGSILTLQARVATAAEKLTFQGTGRYVATSMIQTLGAISAYADVQGTGDVIMEVRVKRTGAITGSHMTTWTMSSTPGNVENSNSAEEHDFESTGAASAVINHSVWPGPTTTTGVGGYGFTYDGAYHTETFLLSKSVTDGMKFYLDEVLKVTGAYSGNTVDKIHRMWVTNHVDVGGTEAAWIATPAGTKLEVDWIRVWRRTGQTHYRPLVNVTDQNIARGGTVDIVIPSALTLWGDASVTEYLQAMQIEDNEPEGSRVGTYVQYPPGVSYVSGTRTLTVAPTSMKAGRLNFVMYGYKPGCTAEPLRFAVNVGPRVSVSVIQYNVGVPLSYDLYAACDCGVLVTNGTTRTKTIAVTGLPVWASYSDSTGLITGASPTDTGTSALSVLVTNSLGQTATASVNLENASAGISAWSTNFTAANGNLESAGLGFTLVAGTSGAAVISANKLAVAGTISASYQTPALVAGNYFAEALFPSNTATALVALDMTDSNNFIGFRRFSFSKVEIYKVIGGVFTLQAKTTTTVGPTNVVRLTRTGTTLALFRDGVPMTTLDSGSFTLATSPPASGRQGYFTNVTATNPALTYMATGTF